MITIIDYGMGNLRSVSKALEHLGAKVAITSSPSDIEAAEKLVLPGVGAFGDAMKELDRLKLSDPIREHVKKGKPFLGICLGLQLIFEESEETPGVRGLGMLKGKVQRFRSANVKVPHMGWNDVTLKQNHPLLQNVKDRSFFYFVHTFYPVPADSAVIAGTCTYGTETFCAMVGAKNLFAAQFHPEKSQEAGLEILKNYIGWKV